MIEVIRKDGSKRTIEIMKDQFTNKWCFVNLTSNHVCKCRFDTYTEALKDLYNDPFVLSWKQVEQKKKERKFVSFLEKVLKITLPIPKW